MYTKLLGNGTLLLQHVKEDREGYYLCQADNGIGTGIGKVIQLRVNCKYTTGGHLCNSNTTGGCSFAVLLGSIQVGDGEER